MNILILSGSPRNNGNTDLLVEAFAKGASEKHHIEIVSVHDYTVHPCTGCNACFSSVGNACVQKDDMPVIYSKLSNADMLVIASPVYFYGLSAQLKAAVTTPSATPSTSGRPPSFWSVPPPCPSSSTASSPNTNFVSTSSTSKTRATYSCAAQKRRVAYGARKR